jgi:hypothetical protein
MNVIAILKYTKEKIRIVFIKGIQSLKLIFFPFLLKVANILCYILLKCSEQEPLFKNMLCRN